MTKEDRRGIAIIVTLVILGMSTFVVSYNIKAKQYKANPQTLCLQDETVKLTKIVVIDKSDKWSSHNIEKIDHWLSEINQGLSMNSRLKIVSISENEQNNTDIKTVFDKCSPGKEEDCHALYENCRDIRHNYSMAFKQPLLDITAMLGRPDESPNSPLFETMTEVVDGIKSQQAEIHIISDFMENGYKFNFYKEIPTVEQLIKQYPLPSNAHITVYLHIIERHKHPRELLDKVKEVWQNYFTKQNIKVKSAKRFFISN